MKVKKVQYKYKLDILTSLVAKRYSYKGTNGNTECLSPIGRFRSKCKIWAFCSKFWKKKFIESLFILNSTRVMSNLLIANI